MIKKNIKVNVTTRDRLFKLYENNSYANPWWNPTLRNKGDKVTLVPTLKTAKKKKENKEKKTKGKKIFEMK